MSDNFNFMWEKLPEILKNNNIEKYYKSISKIFDSFDDLLDTNKLIHVIDFASGKNLENLGKMLGITRGNTSDIVYRRRIKIFYYTYYFVPNLNNILYLINNLLGYSAENVLGGWEDVGNEESGKLKIDMVIPPEGDDSLLIDLDILAGAGVRIDWQKVQEVYLSSQRTGDFDFTGIEEPADWILKSRLTPGVKISHSSGRSKTNEVIPFDVFVDDIN